MLYQTTPGLPCQCVLNGARNSQSAFSEIKDFSNIRHNIGDTNGSFALQATPEEVPEPVVEIQVIEGVNSLALALRLSPGSGKHFRAQKLHLITGKRAKGPRRGRNEHLIQ